MKKISFIALGLFLMGISVVSVSQASRDAYHAYLLQNRSEKVSDNKRILNYRQQKTAHIAGEGVLEQFEARNLRDSSQRKRETLSKRVLTERTTKRVLPRRVYTMRTNPWKQPLNRRKMVVISTVNTEMGTKKLETYENNTFSIQIPEGWTPSVDDEHFFFNPFSDFTLSIERMDDPCRNQTFVQCAVNLSKARNSQYKDGKIVTFSGVSRLHQFRNTIAQSRVQTETLMEGFSTSVMGNDTYMSRFFVADLDGNVYRIEAQVPFDEAGNYLHIIKRIFDSFRIYNEDMI